MFVGLDKKKRLDVKWKAFGCDSTYMLGIVCGVWSKTGLSDYHLYLTSSLQVSFVDLLFLSSFAWTKLHHFGAFLSHTAHSSDPAPMKELSSH